MAMKNLQTIVQKICKQGLEKLENFDFKTVVCQNFEAIKTSILKLGSSYLRYRMEHIINKIQRNIESSLLGVNFQNLIGSLILEHGKTEQKKENSVKFGQLTRKVENLVGIKRIAEALAMESHHTQTQGLATEFQNQAQVFSQAKQFFSMEKKSLNMLKQFQNQNLIKSDEVASVSKLSLSVFHRFLQKLCALIDE